MGVEPVDAKGLAEMQEVYTAISEAMIGKQRSIVLSVLFQVALGNMNNPAKDDGVAIARLTACLSLLSIMENSNAPRDDVSLATAVDNVVNIASVGSPALAIPSLLHAAVALKASGRRNFDAEDRCIKSLRSAMAQLEKELTS